MFLIPFDYVAIFPVFPTAHSSGRSAATLRRGHSALVR